MLLFLPLEDHRIWGVESSSILQCALGAKITQEAFLGNPVRDALQGPKTIRAFAQPVNAGSAFGPQTRIAGKRGLITHRIAA